MTRTRVLGVGDEADIRESVRLTLPSEGYKIVYRSQVRATLN